MRRRTIALLVTLAFGLLVAPLAAHAQPSAKVPRIGFLRPRLASPCRIDSFAQGLRELGYVEGQVTWNVNDGSGVECEARSVIPVLARDSSA